MNKKLKTIMIAILLVGIFVSISLVVMPIKEDKYKGFLENVEQSNGISYVYGIDNPNNQIVVDQHMLSVPYSVESVVGNFDLGFMAFIDGIPQKIRQREDKSSQYIYFANIANAQIKDFIFLIDTENIDTKTSHTLWITHFINPSNSKEKFFQAFECDTPYEFKYNCIKISQLEKKYLISRYQENNLNQYNKYDNPQPLKSANIEINYSLQDKSGIFKLSDQIGQKYRITFFLNHIPIKVNRKDYLEVYLKDLSDFSYPITFINNFKQGDVLYAIAIPIETISSSNPCKSNSLIF